MDGDSLPFPLNSPSWIQPFLISVAEQQQIIRSHCWERWNARILNSLTSKWTWTLTRISLCQHTKRWEVFDRLNVWKQDVASSQVELVISRLQVVVRTGEKKNGNRWNQSRVYVTRVAASAAQQEFKSQNKCVALFLRLLDIWYIPLTSWMTQMNDCSLSGMDFFWSSNAKLYRTDSNYQRAVLFWAPIHL